MPETSSETTKTSEKTYHMAIFWNWYFQTVLAASGGFWRPWRDFGRLPLLETTWGRQKLIQPLKKRRKRHITCVYVQNIILWPFLRPHFASGGLQFKKCPTLVLKYKNTAKLLIISRGMSSISQIMRVGTQWPLSHMLFGGLRRPNVLGQPKLV